MAKQFQRRNGHGLPQSRSDMLCNDDLQEQLDDCSYALDTLGDYRPETVSPLQNCDPFWPNFRPQFNRMGVEDFVPGADKNGELPGPLDIPNSLPSSTINSTLTDTYDTRDVDPTDLSVLGPSSAMLSYDEHAENIARSYWNPLRPPTADPPLRSSYYTALVNIDHPNVMTESHSPTIVQKRKRSVSLTSDEENNDLIDKKSVLKLFFKYIPDPTVSTIKCLAKDFGVSAPFVMDLCCQPTNNLDSSSLHLDNIARASHSILTYRESNNLGVPPGDGSAPSVGVNESTTTTVPYKPPRSNTEASQAADDDPRKKRYPCPQCDGGVTRQADLPRHLKTHVPGQFQCQFPGCNKVFRRKDKLNEHIRRIHEQVTSKFDIAQRREKDPENDPDSGPSRGGGFLQGGKPLQNVQRGASSTSPGCSASGNSSGGVAGEPTTNLEVFYPVLQNKPAVEFMRKFAGAQVIRKLGQGGFSHVYELSVTTGINGNDHEAFACKMIRLPDDGGHEVIERARNEISILRVLDHPHIITFAGAFISTDSIIINTRPVADCNLKEFLNRQSSPLSSVAKCQLWEGVRDLTSAVAYLHGHGRGEGFHGDIKPENILVIQDTEVKSWIRLLLADFGSARLSTSNSQVTHKNQAVTLRYCAPEWFTNNGETGPPSDIWSFGCILIQIVTYLHDRTMADFDTFRARNAESKKDWNYSESLPLVHDWLRFLFRNWSDLPHPTIRHEHMNLISDMLSPIPRERPSAMDVITKLEAYNNVAALKADQARNSTMDLIKQSHEILQHMPSKVYRTTNCGSEHPSIEGLGKWPDETTGLYCKSGKSGLGEPTIMQYAADNPQEALGWKLVISDTVGSDTPRMYGSIQDVEYSTNPFVNYISSTQHVEKEDLLYNQIAMRSIHAESFRSSKVDLVIKPINEQVSPLKMACQQPRRPCFQLKLISKSQQLPVKALEKYHCLKEIRPTGYSRPQKSEQRLGRRPVGRRSHLLAEYTKHTTGAKACWTCQIKKGSWDSGTFGTPCDRCRGSLPSPFKTVITLRGPLSQYADVFFPDLPYSLYKESAIEDLLRKNTVGFTDNKIIVELSSGPAYQPIRLTAHEFVPSNQEFLNQSYVEKDSVGDLQKFVSSYAPPLGLYGTGTNDLRNKCLSHIEAIIKQGRDPGECFLGDTSIISWQVLEAVTRYQKLNSGIRENLPLRKAVMLYAMHYFMSRVIIFTRTSAEEVVTSLRAPKMLLYERTLASKLLNLQLKVAMYAVMRDMTRDVLEGLDRELRRKGKQSSWAGAFSVVLILCMCIEALQVAVDSFTVAFGCGTPSFRESAIEIMRISEVHTFEHILILFHGAYRTARSKRLGFNPIRDGLAVDEKNGVTQGEADLVHDIRRIMKCHEGEIEEKASNLSFEAGPDLLAHHMAFRKRNSGRLVSKFLKSFT